MGLNHARVYREIEGVELAAVADVAPERLSLVFGPRSYQDYRQLLAAESVDLLSICVPTRLHREVALAAIERGVPTLIEKPIAAELTEGREIMAAAQRAGVPLMIGHVERFNPAVLELKRRLERGDLGRVFQVYARRTGPFPERIRDVGVVLDLAPHDIDVMRFLLGSEVERLYAETEQRISTEHEDMLSGLLRFQNGAVGLLDVNWLTPVKIRHLSLLGERGLFTLDYLKQELRLFHRDTELPVDVSPPGIDDAAFETVHVEKREPLRVELEAFVAAVKRGEPPPVGPEEGLAALDIAYRLVESARTHRPVDCAGSREGAP
jgi:predicted dehydrogenase